MTYDDFDETQLVNLTDDGDMADGDTIIAPTPEAAGLEETIVAPMPQEVAVAEEVTGSTRLDGSPAPATPLPQSDARVSRLAERFTAFLIDSYLLLLAYWGGVQLYYHFAHQQSVGLAPLQLTQGGFIVHGAWLIFCFMYYFVFESTLSATPGKLICKLSVQRSDGSVPSIARIALRNFLRLVDYFPFVVPGLAGLMCMETTKQDQRLGDLLADTVCIKRTTVQSTQPIAWNRIAGLLGRSCAAVINGVFLAGLIVAQLWLLDDERLRLSQWIILMLPLITAALWIGMQALTGATPGAWVMGQRIVREDGQQIGVTQAMIRTLLLPIDLLGIGLFALTFSPRRQRVGDMIAGTLVVRGKRANRSAVLTLALLALCLCGMYFGSLNEAALFRTNGTLNHNFDWTFFPRTSITPHWPPTGAPSEPFMIRNFRFAEGSPGNTRSPASYVPGERAWFVFDVHGFHTKRRHVWIQEDLAIRYPDNSFGLRQENIIDYNQVQRQRGPLELKNDIVLPEGFPPGKYTVFITIRDMYADEATIVYNRDFYVKDTE